MRIFVYVVNENAEFLLAGIGRIRRGVSLRSRCMSLERHEKERGDRTYM